MYEALTVRDERPMAVAQENVGELARKPPDDGESPVVDSEELFRNSREIRIRHVGEVYRLRITRNGKLILNK
jgi:hemin uptake protein HemP